MTQAISTFGPKSLIASGIGLVALACAGCDSDKLYLEYPQAKPTSAAEVAPTVVIAAPAQPGPEQPLWTRSGKGPATDYYGSLATVTPGHFTAEVPPGSVPWSGYWYPLRDDTEQASVFDGPLAKYDQWVKAAHPTDVVTTSALQWDRDHRDNATANWEGLCNAWAAASILLTEPFADRTHGKTVNGVNFTVSDLKALAVKSFETPPEQKIIGQRNDGGPGVDYQDLYPDQFHRVLQAELFQKHQAFIMDTDPNVAVWNYPVYSTDIRIEADAVDPHVMHVSTMVVWADDRVAQDFIGTFSNNHLYTYDLYGVPKTAIDGTQVFEVHAGVWTKTADTDSYFDHPDFVTLIVGKERGASFNPELKSEYVDEILR